LETKAKNIAVAKVGFKKIHSVDKIISC